MNEEIKEKENKNFIRCQKVLADLDALNLHLPPDAPSAADLVRQDRDSIAQGGRLR